MLRIAILGSTGSIGQSALSVDEAHPDPLDEARPEDRPEVGRERQRRHEEERVGDDRRTHRHEPARVHAVHEPPRHGERDHGAEPARGEDVAGRYEEPLKLQRNFAEMKRGIQP